MNRISERFASSRRKKRCGFIPFIVAGDPDLQTTADLLVSLNELEPVAIEVGIPFSDPIADGPVIQRAAQRALKNPICLAQILEMTARYKGTAPLVLFSYYNPLLQFGLTNFVRAAAESRIAAVLIIDLPVERARPLHLQLRDRAIDLIFLVAPTTSAGRLRRITRVASGFIYAVSRTGVTGSAPTLLDESELLVNRLRRLTKLPIAVGFGITTAAQVEHVCKYADAAIVGSHLVNTIDTALSRGEIARPRLVAKVVRAARLIQPRFNELSPP